MIFYTFRFSFLSFRSALKCSSRISCKFLTKLLVRCCDLNVSPPNSYIEIITLNLMVLRGGAFRRWLGHEGRVLMSEIGALTKEACGSSSDPSTAWGHIEEMAIYELGKRTLTRPWLCQSLDQGLPSLQNCEREMFVASKQLWTFVYLN